MKNAIHSPYPFPLSFPRRDGRSCAAIRSEIRFLLKASRPGFWLTAMWFYLLALGPSVPLHSPAFWLGLFYVGFPLGLLIYGGNDLTDAATDAINPRKDTWLFGARPTAAQIKRLPARIFLIQAPFIVLFTFLLGPIALVWIVTVLLASQLYNAPWGAKNRPGFDMLAQSGYVMVFVLANWLCGLPQASWTVFVFGALFAMHSHLFGEIMDIEPDTRAGRNTTAICIGVKRTKLLMSALLCIEALLALTIAAKPWLAPILAVSAIGFLLDALVLWRDKPYATWQTSLFFVGWNLFLLGEVALSAAFWHSAFFR